MVLSIMPSTSIRRIASRDFMSCLRSGRAARRRTCCLMRPARVPRLPARFSRKSRMTSSNSVITTSYEARRRFLTEDCSSMRDDEFERLYAAEAAGLFSFLAYRTGDRALAEDLLADAFERALRARAPLRPPARLAEDLAVRDRPQRACATTRGGRPPRPARSSGRARPRRPPADPLAAVEHRDELGRALATLSAEEREAIALRFGADLTVPEIAKLLGEPLTTAEGRIYRALRKLRAELS